MNSREFEDSLQNNVPPSGLSLPLQALWYDAKGDWQQAHNLIQDEPGAAAALIHAYLHRREGDIWNADYWYKKAGEKRPAVTLQEEWAALVAKLQ